MARVTIEDCIVRVPNRFELVILALRRARDIASGCELTVDRDRDKNPVVALREIAEETVDTDELRESIIQSLRRHVEIEEPEEDLVELGVPVSVSEGAGSESAESEAVESSAVSTVKEEIAEGMRSILQEAESTEDKPAPSEEAPDEA